MKNPFLIKCLQVFLAIAPVGAAYAVEEPPFRVEARHGEVEIRAYGPVWVAETTVSGTFSEAGNKAFRPLFNFINGNNTRQEKIAMTAPVRQEPAAEGEKIAMTAPVTQRAAADGEGRFVIGFVMPAQMTRETLPLPKDPQVTLREIAPRRVAALRYSGTWSAERYQQHEKALLEAVERAGLVPTGRIEFARYDPPIMPWFLRRNEVIVEVTDRPASRG